VKHRVLPNGVWGMLVFIASETAFFGTLIGAYGYLRFTSRAWPPPGVEAPSVALPIVLTAVLVLSAGPTVLAVRAAEAERLNLTRLLLLVGFCMQVGYLIVQVISYASDMDKFSATGTAYGSIYFTMLGAHHAHVAIGLLIDLWLFAKLATGFTPYRITSMRVAGWYWVFVAVVGVAVTAVQVSPA
jgi:heme/copper-type cytochrome/quinol oxidase subunit 3